MAETICTGKIKKEAKKRIILRNAEIRGDIALIPLTRGETAIIDVSDLYKVQSWNWCAVPTEGNFFYAMTTENKHMVLMHRKILGLSSKDDDVDHIDRNGLNNRKNNLRLTDAKRNAYNRISQRNSTSQYKGVHLDSQTGKYRACSRMNGKFVDLGRYRNEEDAARAYDNFAVQNFGEFALTNFSKDGVLLQKR